MDSKLFFVWALALMQKILLSSGKEPCERIEAYGNVFLQCENLQNKEQLKNAMTEMHGRDFTELSIATSNLTFIPHDLFRDSTVSRIKLKNCVMFYLFDRELENTAERITQITLDNIDFEGGLDWTVLSNLDHLQTFSVTGSLLEKIVYDVLELDLPLETLILVDDGIETVDDNAFQNLKNLKNLKLSSNSITAVKRSMFPSPTSKVQFLDFSYNKLTSLPNDLFDGLTQLHTLILRGNQLQALQKIPVQTVFSSLFFFDVIGNPLQCDCGLAWMLGEEKKPFHLFGMCSVVEIRSFKNLRELSRDDFVDCQL